MPAARSRAQGGIKLCGLHIDPMGTVVMELTEGETADKVLLSDVCEKTEKVTQKLHDSQPVFGDLRAPNAMFQGDFDWTGKVKEARYPRNRSTRVERQPILADHDRFMLNHPLSQVAIPLRITGIDSALGSSRGHSTIN
jgi:hypothetical protein